MLRAHGVRPHFDGVCSALTWMSLPLRFLLPLIVSVRRARSHCPAGHDLSPVISCDDKLSKNARRRRRPEHRRITLALFEFQPRCMVIEIDPLGNTDDGIIHVTARFGYMETPDVRRALGVLEPTKTEGLIAIDDASYFLSKIELTNGGDPTMPAWRKNLFIATSRLSTDAAESFCLPRDRTLIIGSRIEI